MFLLMSGTPRGNSEVFKVPKPWFWVTCVKLDTYMQFQFQLKTLEDMINYNGFFIFIIDLKKIPHRRVHFIIFWKHFFSQNDFQIDKIIYREKVCFEINNAHI